MASRRIFYAAIFAVTVFAVTFASATAAVHRPNQLDRRVDAIPAAVLMSRPATALVDPNRQSAALRLDGLELPGWVLGVLFQAGALAYFWGSGAAAAWRDRLRARIRRTWLVRFAFGATLALIARFAALLPAFYLYRVERVMDLSTQLTRVWGMYWLAHTVLAAVIAGAIAALVLWLVDRTHQWYAYLILIILAVSLGWSYASPYFDVFGSPARRATAALQQRVDAALTRGGIPSVPVFVQASSASTSAGASVLGLGPFHRVVLSDATVAAETPDEAVYRVTYALEHALHADPLFAALIEGGIIIVFSALAVVLADRVGFRRDDDPLSRLALVGALLALVYLAAVPVRNAALRSYDLDADRSAVALTGNPAAAVRALVREADQRLEAACPSPAATAFLAVHPSPAQRIVAINGISAACP